MNNENIDLKLSSVIDEINLNEKVMKLRTICNAGYCDVNEFDSFESEKYKAIEMEWKNQAKPYIEIETNKIVFIEIYSVDEVVNGCKIITPFEGTDEEIKMVYNKITEPKKNITFTIISSLMLFISVFLLVLYIIIGYTSAQFQNFFSFVYLTTPTITFVGVALIALMYSLKK